jgi:ribose transport system substrate-binding protein
LLREEELKLRSRIACSTAGAVAAALLAQSFSNEAVAGTKGTIVAFVISSTNPYIGQWEKGAKAKADELGYDIKFIENNFNQTEEDNQVRQELASGEKAAGYIWWPMQNAAGIGSLRDLSKTGAPVILTNQYPVKGSDAYWTAYAGASDVLSGKVAAQMLLEACAKQTKVKCDKGLIIRFPAGYSAGDDRVTGFEDVAKGKLTVTDVVPSAGFMEDDGYKVASQIIPAHKQALTWIYTENDSMAGATAQALKENGLTPGKDVFVVGGTCHGDPTHVVNGDLVGTAIQSGYFEGWLAVQTLAKYKAAGKVLDGEKFYDANPDTPPPDQGAPYKFNFIPNPPVSNTQAAYDSTKMWGKTIKELCDF